MAIVTLSQLRTRVRERSDQVNSLFVSDSEIDTLINNGKRKLDDILVRNFGEEYSATAVTFLTTATENYSLSTLTSGAFYKSLAVSQSGPTGWRDCEQYNFRERNALRSSSIQGVAGNTYRYRVIGGNLSLLPTPVANVRMELYYIPQTVALSSTTDSFDDTNGWSEIIVLTAAIAIKDKEESDVSILMADLAREEARITASAPNRDAGQPQTVGDVIGSPWPGSDDLRWSR
jgi:hypothetical protein